MRKRKYKFKINERECEIKLSPEQYKALKRVGFELGIENMISNFLIIIQYKGDEVNNLLIEIMTELIIKRDD